MWINRSFLSSPPAPRAFLDGLLFAIVSAAVSVAAWHSQEFKSLLIGNPEKIFQEGEWYRVVTSILLHADLRHLLANMVFLVPFAGLLTNYYGRSVFPVLGFSIGILSQIVSLETYPPHANLMGASGLLYVLFGLWLALYFRAESHLPRAKRWMRILGFGLVMFIPSQVEQTVSYRTHYIGLGLGLVAGTIYGFLKRRDFERRNRPYRITSTADRGVAPGEDFIQ